MKTYVYTIISVLFAFIVQISNAKYTEHGKNLAVYWGQGAYQESLATYCQTQTFDIVMVSFLNNFNGSTASFNFGNACWGSSCTQIASDIKTCQNLGIKVLLSLGGDKTMGSYGFGSDDDGRAGAKVVYDMFHPNGDAGVAKPFGDAEIDGFDFDIENENQVGLAAFAKKLRDLWTSKTLLLSATPQCPYPDKNTLELLESTDAKIDFAFVQFYNSPQCAFNNEAGFYSSWDTWSEFVSQKSGNKDNMQIYLGLPGSNLSMYVVDLETTKARAANITTADRFGGVFLWDAVSATANVDSTSGLDYISGVHKILNGEELSKREMIFSVKENHAFSQSRTYSVIEPQATA